MGSDVIQVYARHRLCAGDCVTFGADVSFEWLEPQPPNPVELLIQAAATKLLYDYSRGTIWSPGHRVLLACERVGADAETIIRLVRRDELEMIGDMILGVKR
jgi:hypothetical protein